MYLSREVRLRQGLVLIFPLPFLLAVSRRFCSWLRNGLCGTISKSSMHRSAETGGLSAGIVTDERLIMDLSASLRYGSGLRIEAENELQTTEARKRILSNPSQISLSCDKLNIVLKSYRVQQS